MHSRTIQDLLIKLRMLHCAKLLKWKQESLSPVHTKTSILLKQTHKSVINHFTLGHYIAHKWNIHLNFKNKINVWRHSFLMKKKRTMACKKKGLCKVGNWQGILYNIRKAVTFCFIPVLQYITLLQTNGRKNLIYQGKSSVSEAGEKFLLWGRRLFYHTHRAIDYLGHFSWWENGTYLWKLALKQNILKSYCNDQANGTAELKFQCKFPLVKIGNTYERHNINEHLPPASKK